MGENDREAGRSGRVTPCAIAVTLADIERRYASPYAALLGKAAPVSVNIAFGPMGSATFDEFARFPMSRRQPWLSVARISVRDVKPKRSLGWTSRSASGTATGM
jgi:hypothetical protein